MRKLSNKKLIARWDKRQHDIILFSPKSKADVYLVVHRLFGMMPGEGFMEELERRGYDVTTFWFEIALKEN